MLPEESSMKRIERVETTGGPLRCPINRRAYWIAGVTRKNLGKRARNCLARTLLLNISRYSYTGIAEVMQGTNRFSGCKL